jgi:pimeloyl-ACP methyl ester carboxylesterase
MAEVAQRRPADRLHQGGEPVRFVWALLILAAAAVPVRADEPPADGPPDDAFARFAESIPDKALEMQTLGGRFFWGDVLHFRGWRVQQNVLTKHYRLLDPDDKRFFSGTLESCVARLEEIKKEQKLRPMSGKAVILVHGMGRSSKSWPALTKRLERDGYLVLGFDYPSTRCEITESAEYLAKVIDGLDGIDQIDFVVHSMGGLVVRAYLAEHHDERIKRMVMLGVPNLGAEMADRVVSWPLYQWVCGPGGCQLGTDPAGLIASLPTPDFEFAIVSGAKGTPDGYNPLIPGDDDGTVTVASTRLPGAADFMLIGGTLHSFLMFDERVVDVTTRFLQTGRLRAAGEPQPIPRESRETKGESRERKE